MRNARRNILVALPALLVLCPAVSLAEEGIWTKKADMPTARGMHSAWGLLTECFGFPK